MIPTLTFSFPLSQISLADTHRTWETVLELGSELNSEQPLHEFFGIWKKTTTKKDIKTQNEQTNKEKKKEKKSVFLRK